jgi:hypothetical protein
MMELKDYVNYTLLNNVVISSLIRGLTGDYWLDRFSTSDERSGGIS